MLSMLFICVCTKSKNHEEYGQPEKVGGFGICRLVSIYIGISIEFDKLDEARQRLRQTHDKHNWMSICALASD